MSNTHSAGKKSNHPGEPDPTFNEGRQVNVYPRDNTNALASAIAPLQDESILVATFDSHDVTGDQFYVTKVLPQGELATDFGNFQDPTGARYLKDSFRLPTTAPHLHAAADGTFYLLSVVGNLLLMAKYTADGLPGEFASAKTSKVALLLGVLTEGSHFRVEGEMISTFDGETFYIAVTAVLENGDTLACVTAVSREGAPAESFNGTGQLFVHPPHDVARAMKIRGLDIHRDAANLGKPVVAVGWADGPGEALFVARYDVQGDIDTTFGELGFAWIDAARLSHMQVVVDPAGTVKLCGSVIQGTAPAPERTYEKVFAFTASGHIDVAFNGGTALLETTYPGAPENRAKVIFRASEQPSGYRLTCTKFTEPTLCMAARLLESGTMDRAFGDDGLGYIRHTSVSDNLGETMELHPRSGKILIARHIYTLRNNA